MTVEHYYKELINVESSELYERYISDDYVDEYRLACLKILNERDDFSKEETARKNENASKEVYYEGYGMITAWKMMFKHCVNFEGRSCRSEFWYAYLIQYVVLAIFMITSAMELSFFSTVSGIYIFVSIIPMYTLVVRRLHDVGKSGLFWFLNFIPFGGIYLIILFCTDSEKGKNIYGENPKKRERKKEKGISVETNIDNQEQYIEGKDNSNNISESVVVMTTPQKEALELNRVSSFCRKCGTQLLEDSEFCHKCGCEKVR